MNTDKNQDGYFSGTSGINLPLRRFEFPEEYQSTSRLTYYSSIFNSIEINSTFYKLPQLKTVLKWSTEVGENFKFTFKFWKQVTHTKGLSFQKADIEQFMNVVAHASAKKGCLLFQFPPSLDSRYFVQFEKLVHAILEQNIAQPWKIAVEFRNKTWYNEKVFQLLDSNKIALVIQDIPSSATPLIESDTDFVYVRFHGPTGNYRDSYTDDFLLEYSGYIKDWLSAGKTVYVYFNNTAGDAFNNLKSLNKYVAA